MTSDCLLVVEPDLAVRHPLAQYLRECGYKVLEAVDTDEAIAILSDSGVRVDVVLADVHSPGQVDGFGLSMWIKAQGLPTEVILAGTVERAAEKAGDLCENGPVGKPFHHHTLVDDIKRHLARRDRNSI
jgi:DNA-binding response OmpR family regulator